MSPYADSIGWLSEDPSTPVEPARLYSFPRHLIYSLFRLCLQSGLMNYSAPAEILANYCPYHQVMGHSIENCTRFKDDVQRLIGQGLINLGDYRVNPPQPHIQQPRFKNPGIGIGSVSPKPIRPGDPDPGSAEPGRARLSQGGVDRPIILVYILYRVSSGRVHCDFRSYLPEYHLSKCYYL